MGKVIILTGIPCIGKSYFIKDYIQKHPDESYVVCSADHHFEELAKQKRAELLAANDPTAQDKLDYLYDFKQIGLAHGKCKQKCLNALEQNIETIFIDNTNISQSERREYIGMAVRFGYDVAIKAFPKDESAVQLAIERNKKRSLEFVGKNIPDGTIAKKAMQQDLEPGMYNVGLDPEDIRGSKYITTRVLEAVQFIKTTAIKAPTLDEVSQDIVEVKEKITAIKLTYPEDKTPEIAEALDDMTGALDVAQHHIEDIKGKLTTES